MVRAVILEELEGYQFDEAASYLHMSVSDEHPPWLAIDIIHNCEIDARRRESG
jgi:hypothetical protein